MPCDYIQLANPGVTQLTPYQAGKPIEELRRELGLDEIIKLASNENPLGASPKAIAAAKKSLDEIALYPDSHNYELKSALAEFHEIDPQRISVANGSDYLFSLLVQAFVPPDGEVIISEYAFATFSIVIHANQAQPVTAPANGWAHDLSAMLKAITPKTRLILIANPNNPTATWFPEHEFIEFMQHVPAHILVVMDEAYFEFAQHPSYPDTLKLQKTYPNLITTRTFSKAYGLAGLRIGYCIAQPDCIDCLERIRLPFSVNRAAQAAAIAALHDQQHIENTISNNQAGQAQLQVGFRRLELGCLPSVCNFLTVDMKQAAIPIYNALLKHGIIVRPLLPYNMLNHLRITIGTEKQNQRLIVALEIILDT